MSTPNRTVATILAAFFLTAAFAPLVAASTEPTPNGDIVINGRFTSAVPAGHPAKTYCDPYNPSPADPRGELGEDGPEGTPEEVYDPVREGCAAANEFVAYDWTAPSADVAEGEVSLAETGGIVLKGNAFIQQHMAGTEGADRLSEFYHLRLTGLANAAGAGGLRAELRVDTGSGVVSYTKSVTFGTTSTVIDLTRADLLAGGAGAPVPDGLIELRSVRLWSNAGADITLTQVELFATNGVEDRNILILPAGDDVVSSLDGVGVMNAGDDGMYSFLVGMATDGGEFLATRDAWICAYTAEQARDDFGFPENTPDQMCVDSFLDPEHPDVVKTQVGNAIRVDVPAELIDVQVERAADETRIPAIAIYAQIKVDGSYDLETPDASSEFKSGYFNLARMAAANAGAGVSIETPFPTPVLIDANGDGTPDYVQADEADGYSVIITPRNAIETATATVIRPADGHYEFEVQVFQYEGVTGAPMTLDHCIAFALFNGEGLVNGGAFDAAAFWSSECDGAQSPINDGEAILVRVPEAAVTGNPVAGAWAFYDVEAPFRWNVASEPYGGYSQSATDFYSVLRNTVKGVVVADGFRAAGTAMVFDATGASSDLSASTTAIRMDGTVDEITPLDGTLVVGDNGDGSITFEYALFTPAGLATAPAADHRLAIYDAAGAISDDLQPGAVSQLEHAEWIGVGSLVSYEDGTSWYRIDVPVSAFDDVQGPAGVWAHIAKPGADGFVCCSTWFNLAKDEVAAVSPSAAEALYAPTPVVLLDAQLGIPKTLASTVAGLGTGVLSISNPFVNPGFEADLQVEGRKDTADNTGATMTTPPWFFRLDDKGTGQPTNPRSTHEVAAGAGRFGDSALRVQYNTLDNGKGLMLGQLFGVEDAGASFVWKGASSVAFDVKTQSSSPLQLSVVLRWLDETGAVRMTSVPVTVQPSMQWQRVEATMNVPATGQLLGFYLAIKPASTMTFLLDSFVLKGATTALGDARSDLSDGYAMVIEPQGLAGGEQRRVTGAGAVGYYLYDVTVIDYTTGQAAALPTSGLAKSFGLRTDALAKDVGTILPIRGVDDKFAVAIPASDVPDTPAAPWAWVHAGGVYNPLVFPVAMQAASGYYSPVKNALAGSALADSLDYAGTPVTFGTASARTQTFPQEISLVPVSGGYAVRVKANSPYVETTELKVSNPSLADRYYPVTLESLNGDLVPGLVLTQAEFNATTLTTNDSIFTTGAKVVAGDPIAIFSYCRQVGTGCSTADILSNEALVFQSFSFAPSGETFTKSWNFNGTVRGPFSQDDTVFAFTTPGLKTVTLTVQTPSGKTGSTSATFMVNNRDPTIKGIDITPFPAFRDSQIRIGARASDPDNGRLQYTWRIDDVVVPHATGASFILNESQILATIGAGGLQVGTYNVSLSVVDGQGSDPVTDARDLVIVARPPTVAAPILAVPGVEDLDYALVGETVKVNVLLSDPDTQVTGVELRAVTGDFEDLVLAQLTPGVWTGEFTPAQAAELTLQAVALTAAGDVASATVPFEIRTDAAPVIDLVVPTMIQSGENATFTATAVDPDNRSLGAMVWKVDGIVATDAVDGTLTRNFVGMGVHTIEVTVDGETVSKVLKVDDIITVGVAVGPVEPAQPVEVTVTVLDVNGQPVQGAVVRLAHFVGPIPAAVATLTATTGADGKATFNVGEIGGLVSLPVDHRVVATARAASLAGAPDMGIEQAQGEATWGVLGTLLP